jgi:hypothetical protein
MSPTKETKMKLKGAEAVPVIALIEIRAEFAVLDLHSRALITACFG